MYKRFRFLTVALLSVSLLLLTPEAFSATKQANLIATFQKYLSDGEKAFNAAKSAADNEFVVKISESQQRLQIAKTQILNSSQVTIKKFSLESSYRGYLSCPKTRPDCIGVDKGAQFQPGEITLVKPEVLANAGSLEVMKTIFSYLSELDSIFKLGEIQLASQELYDSNVGIFRNEYLNLYSLNSQYSNAISQAKSALLEVNSRQFAIKSSINAARRASKNSQIFDKAFVTAFKFEYNRYSLDKYASQPWSNITNLKSLDSLVKITRLSEKADSIDSNYSFDAATQLNSSLGKIFVGEPEFKSDFDFIAKLYKSVTNSKLSA